MKNYEKEIQELKEILRPYWEKARPNRGEYSEPFDGHDESRSYLWRIALTSYATPKDVREKIRALLTPPPDIREAILKEVTVEGGTLQMRSWHGGSSDDEDPSCGTTHCIAGWTTHLSGPYAWALESIVGPAFAAEFILNTQDLTSFLGDEEDEDELFHLTEHDAMLWLRGEL